jgi:SAM-dependent methyltransferase
MDMVSLIMAGFSSEWLQVQTFAHTFISSFPSETHLPDTLHPGGASNPHIVHRRKEKQRMHQENWNPESLLGLSGSYWQTCTLHAAVKLDLFTRIGNETLSAEELVKRMGGDSRGLFMLLNALTAMGLLSKSDGAYANTAPAKTFLSRDAEQYIGHMILHHHHLVDAWARLDRAVLTGKPVRERASVALDEFRESFLMGMHTLARFLAPRVAEVLDLSGRKRLLDLGGGPGTYAVQFCLNNPGLRATVFDLPTSRAFAERRIQDSGLADRADFVGGNFLEDPLPAGCDVAWLSHILHSNGPESCQCIIDKTVACLEPGGLIVIHEFLLNDPLDGPLFPALFSLNMLVGTPDGQAYAEGQIRDMLDRAGVKEIRRLPFRGPNDSGLLAGLA